MRINKFTNLNKLASIINFLNDSIIFILKS